MATASEVFNEMFGIKRSIDEKEDDPILVEETSIVLEALLKIFYPNLLEINEPTFSLLCGLAVAADKYVMTGVTRIVKRELFYGTDSTGANNANAKQFPAVELFGLANRMGWKEESKLASTNTLSQNIFSEKCVTALAKLDGPSVVALCNLHHKRKSELMKAIDITEWLAARVEARLCSSTAELWTSVRVSHLSCVMHWNMLRDVPLGGEPLSPKSSTGSPKLHKKAKDIPRSDLPSRSFLQAWSTFMQLVAGEIDKISLGSTLQEDVFWHRAEFANLWTLKCPNCSGALVSRATVKQAVLMDLGNLPKTI